MCPRSRFTPVSVPDSTDRARMILRDGSSATIRRARPDDLDAMRAFFGRIAPTSLQHKFFSSSVPTADHVDQLCADDDSASILTLLVTRIVEGEERVIAVGSYTAAREGTAGAEVSGPGTDAGVGTAEVGMAVDPAFRGKGLGTLMLERLALAAVAQGLQRFVAYALSDNDEILAVFRSTGFGIREHQREGFVEVALSLAADDETVARSEVRDRVATAASIRPFFHPRAVAVVGASRDPESLGFRVLEALVMNRFCGPVYPVNPTARVVGSIRAYPSVAALPEPVDLAVIVVPKRAVAPVIEECAANGVRALVVITAGFAETGAEGARAQAEILERVRAHGMRMVGPNCMGLLNTDPSVQLAATFAPVYPPAGRIAMASQSGALGVAILGLTQRLELGLSTFVSIGNQADVAANDLLQYWEADEGTDVILLYLESFGDPRRFARIARRVSHGKPIVTVKGGRTSAGHRAAGSHTAALAAADVAVDALFQQTGVIRAETLQGMFDLANTLANQPLPRGRRVGIVTNAGGPAILCADACETGGLELPELSAETRARLQEFLSPDASTLNPVDMIASATPEDYGAAAKIVLDSGEVDALIVISVPLGEADTPAIVRNIDDGVAAGRRAGAVEVPVLACMIVEGAQKRKLGLSETIPTYLFPETAARVLAKVADYAEWRREPLGRQVDFDDIDPARARGVCDAVLESRGDGWLSAAETRDVLQAFGLPVTSGGIAHDANAAAAMASEIGYPVALKAASHRIVHKTEMGGVRLDLADADAVRSAFTQMIDATKEVDAEAMAEGVLVQPMVDGGVEVMVGVSDDPLFGPVLAFGLGGVHVEILRDVAFRVTPLTGRDAREMVREIRGYRLLEGYRGHAPADVAAIEETLLRTSHLVEEVPTIRELDLNPIITLPPGRGCSIVDARIRVAGA